ncbi:MAG: transketolase, partial [Myxococcota bacterium]|nr:transketolase [Myxococcota bacterium]
MAMDAVQAANSGHPGMPMGMADAAAVLWQQFLTTDPEAPSFVDRDRFILSAGHGSMLLYALLHLSGHDLPLSELKRFRQLGSKTPGHPEVGLTAGVETTTGPLGQGVANGVGMAMAEAYLGALFNRTGHTIVDHMTYGICSDGDLQEGISHEAASLAGHLGLGKLVFLWDDNHISIDGSTDLSFTEDVGKRFEAYGWQVLRADGHDHASVAAAIEAGRADAGRPTLICTRTHIGHGSPNKQDTAASHGAPLGDEEIRLTKEAIGWPFDEPFHVPADVYGAFADLRRRGRERREAWSSAFQAYEQAHPNLARLWRQIHEGDGLPGDIEALLPSWDPDKKEATRASSGRVINALAEALPTLWGGSADLAGSNKTLVSGQPSFQKAVPDGRNLHYGVREHGMGGVMNGMALHGGVIPYGGTFLTFSDYMRGSIRLAALMHQRAIYVLSHDSVFLGEDGPTHQPVEHAASLRAIPDLTVFRPADANETAAAWHYTVNGSGP